MTAETAAIFSSDCTFNQLLQLGKKAANSFFHLI